MADHVTMIRQGTIVMSAPLPAIEASHQGRSLDEIFVSLVGADT